MNSSMPVILQVGGREFTHQIEPKQVWSYCHEQVPFGMDHSEQIHVGAIGSAVTLYMESCRARRDIAQAIADEQMQRLRVFEAIIGIRFVIFERGWPAESPRRIMAEHRHPEDGVTEYSRTFTPRTSAPGVTFLAAGWHPDRRVDTLLYENMESINVDRNRVVIIRKPNLSTVTLPTQDADTATRLAAALRAESVQTIEVNEFVRGIVLGIGQENDPTLIFGFDNLIADDQREYAEAGAASVGREELTSGYPAYMIVKPFVPPTPPKQN